MEWYTEREVDFMESVRFAENVLMILKHDEIPVGKFEVDNGLSKGSLSKFAKATRSSITLDKAYEIAESLGYDFIDVMDTDWRTVFAEEDKQNEIEFLNIQKREIESRLAELTK